MQSGWPANCCAGSVICLPVPLGASSCTRLGFKVCAPPMAPLPPLFWYVSVMVEVGLELGPQGSAQRWAFLCGKIDMPLREKALSPPWGGWSTPGVL